MDLDDDTFCELHMTHFHVKENICEIFRFVLAFKCSEKIISERNNDKSLLWHILLINTFLVVNFVA